MSHPGLLLTLADDLDTETAEDLAALLSQIKGIATVALVDGAPVPERMAEQRTLTRCRAALMDLARNLR